MASAVCYNSVNPSTAVFSRTHFPVPIHKVSFTEFSRYVHCNYHFRTRTSGQSKKLIQVKATVAESSAKNSENDQLQTKKKLRILVAGGGIGGLVLALAAKRKGFEVIVFEKDISAIRGEGQYRGPIQIQSNALAALEAIDLDVAEEVMRAGCVTGDRINGLVDGISGSWYIKFDTFSPAAERGLPVTRVISRMTLQQILARAVGDDIIFNDSNVIDFEDHGDKVSVVLENGQCYAGDLLVGADGIWSKVSKNLFGPKEAIYSGYTCYTGIADFVPADIDTVGYRVFLGHKQYFVASDVGAGKMQWYAFHKEPPGGVDGPQGKKERLLKIFEGWCDNVLDLILATDEEAILRRDIYDRTPTFTWGRGRVTLLGDSVHAMQPNLGQGGCMAIEDSYQLAMELDKAWKQSMESKTPTDVVSALKSYEKARRLRVAIIHGMARMAAIMASTYKAYLGVGLGPLSFLTKFRIPHPGRVGGRIFIDIAMPLMLSWVLGGNSSKLEGRFPSCRLSDKASDQLQKWFNDSDALERAMNAEWFLVPSGSEAVVSQPICLSRDENEPCAIGSETHKDFPETSIVIRAPQVSKTHARISYKEGAFFLIDLRSEHGTFITDVEGRRYRVSPNFPARFRPSDVIEFGSDKKAVFRVKALGSSKKLAEKKDEGEILQAV
ncbi:Zeaxanthin epoxidase, chloroplastic [Melia azedarach]|uniref:Zeaxanthin epoxidase, chloroplastic n=2 Tax=Melia azedarach TaxID=155640 RepID=A0ACC1XTU0_MELAZ|nr:Zeaxanthin epoxidase, chloroplastic [Melia azedarach]KAJ4714877.1 Zeaxanthin epoxidase, chloroplastic [Melia azedarach]